MTAPASSEILARQLAHIHQRIHTACQQAERDANAVQLLAVSKTFPASDIATAYACGQRAFGENYIQEAVDKIAALRSPAHAALQWHCIGPIQSNKTRSVAENFDWVHTIDRLKIAQRLSEQRPSERAPLQVLIQVNADGGANKSGIDPATATELALAIAALPRLQLRGIMAIPEPAPDFATQLHSHQQVKAVFDQVKDHLQQHQPTAASHFDTLSLGMSSDLEAAIAAGSTMVRIGTAIFGQRSAHPDTAGQLMP
ncbi:hypothetical protein SAMN02745117_01997 [Lampropedia hyalina DSM 16112]|uniref:Pyridoxal phosphate homeostasis protein n=1 Tax=Lampropedia hyalina DSM 16112 TaxID=1122156 RepID=A0A1M5BV05_9BURK|nr:YggS family pyridoxal phosphate-dependent enzyme [Lampropedia hyalina]SHF46062.1 hypothetical protein SAMN02745117_01997 [Lampropedia hyalina DSM 16112]